MNVLIYQNAIDEQNVQIEMEGSYWSGETIISSDKAVSANIVPEANDNIYCVHSVGGSKFVYTKIVDEI
ncbi:hypothetical protein ABE15_09815 [Bacillus cereus]|nr:hypothetical protein [Bacillus cereus]